MSIYAVGENSTSRRRRVPKYSTPYDFFEKLENNPYRLDILLVKFLYDLLMPKKWRQQAYQKYIDNKSKPKDI